MVVGDDAQSISLARAESRTFTNSKRYREAEIYKLETNTADAGNFGLQNGDAAIKNSRKFAGAEKGEGFMTDLVPRRHDQNRCCASRIGIARRRRRRRPRRALPLALPLARIAVETTRRGIPAASIGRALFRAGAIKESFTTSGGSSSARRDCVERVADASSAASQVEPNLGGDCLFERAAAPAGAKIFGKRNAATRGAIRKR